MSSPFFSICIPTYNRSKKLARALKSVLAQQFDDYEIIVSDNNSSDDTVRVVKRFDDRRVRLFRNAKNIGMVPNWNSALMHARGTYATLLFDDDAFLPSHLSEAHKVLSKNTDIGIYAVGNQNSPLPRTGQFSPQQYFRYIYSIAYVSTPSETIFLRTVKDKPFQFNLDYAYCPEVGLYLDVASRGLGAYLSKLQTVERLSDASSNSIMVELSWTPFSDKFALIEQYKRSELLSRGDYARARRLNATRALEKYAKAKFQNKGKPQEIAKGLESVLAGSPLLFAYVSTTMRLFDIAATSKLFNIVHLRKFYHFLGK